MEPALKTAGAPAITPDETSARTMCFWWVNQNQIYRHEVAGGYLWSPKVKSNGDRNPYYEFMREVAPGDMIFSFADTPIRAYGVARSHAYEAVKPEEFGSAGKNWDAIGWRVDVEFFELQTFFRPADWIERLRPLLPQRYAPLNERGHGSQSIYLTELPEPLALTLADLVSADAGALARATNVGPSQLSGANTEQLEVGGPHSAEASSAIPRSLTPSKRLWCSHDAGKGCFAHVFKRSRLTAA